MINVKVEGSKSESNSNILRRFSRRSRYAGIVNKKRSIDSRTRPESKAKRKHEKLRRIERLKEIDRKIKLGKLPDRRYNK
jgi:ribosomal protein S21